MASTVKPHKFLLTKIITYKILWSKQVERWATVEVRLEDEIADAVSFLNAGGVTQYPKSKSRRKRRARSGRACASTTTKLFLASFRQYAHFLRQNAHFTCGSIAKKCCIVKRQCFCYAWRLQIRIREEELLWRAVPSQAIGYSLRANYNKNPSLVSAEKQKTKKFSKFEQ